MSKALKWILGILGVLIVVAVVVGVGFLVVSHWGGARWMVNARAFEPYKGEQVNPWRNTPQNRMPMNPGWNMPMLRRGGFPFGRFGGFFPLGLILGGLFWAAVVFFVVLGVIYLIRGRNNVKKQAAVAAVPAAPATVETPIDEESMPAESPEQAAATCSNCGREVQQDWSHCPYCGQQLK